MTERCLVPVSTALDPFKQKKSTALDPFKKKPIQTKKSTALYPLKKKKRYCTGPISSVHWAVASEAVNSIKSY